MEVSVATLGNLDNPLGESTPGPRTIASPELSQWKLVTKKFSGVATVPRESGRHKETPHLSFDTLKLPSLNKDTLFSMEKRGLTERSGKTWKNIDEENRRNNKYKVTILFDDPVIYRGWAQYPHVKM